MQSSVLYCKKANNYLNIKGKKLDVYFRIALIIIRRSLWTEFPNMFFSSLLQAKGAFLRLARDRTVCACGLPYHLLWSAYRKKLMTFETCPLVNQSWE